MPDHALLVRPDIRLVSRDGDIVALDASGTELLRLQGDVASRIRTLLRIDRMTERISRRLIASLGPAEADAALRRDILPEFCRRADERPPAPGGQTAEMQRRELMECLPSLPSRLLEFLNLEHVRAHYVLRISHLVRFMCQRRILGEPLNCWSLFVYLVYKRYSCWIWTGSITISPATFTWKNPIPFRPREDFP